ncbi:hypothetical protein MUK42_23875 [Musa troglodytarum]|uniref:Uncharacterized protein n=1 Tax=Musa troglodytarum TaxID=320322 RepID=A0A9E7G6J9_9LILI|nr:hypothetical protein MUK42_23875 [Musa troglodytarum]
MGRFLPPPQPRSTSWLLPPTARALRHLSDGVLPGEHCTTDLNCTASACTHFVTMTLTFNGLRTWSEDMEMAGVRS